MSKPTPGPWKVDHHYPTPRVWAADPTGVAVICDMPYWKKEHWAEMYANAYLIAAAPDLLAALKGLLGPGCVYATPSKINAALDAIAAAEGGGDE